MTTLDPCGCTGCNEVRMLAAWCVLADVEDVRTRVCARILLNRWERASRDGNHPTEVLPTQTELEAMQACATFIREHGQSLASLHRHVGVSGTPPA